MPEVRNTKWLSSFDCCVLVVECIDQVWKMVLVSPWMRSVHFSMVEREALAHCKSNRLLQIPLHNKRRDPPVHFRVSIKQFDRCIDKYQETVIQCRLVVYRTNQDSGLSQWLGTGLNQDSGLSQWLSTGLNQDSGLSQCTGFTTLRIWAWTPVMASSHF